MLQNCAEKRGDKVRIIYIIIDEPSEKDVKLVDEKGWTKVELYLEASSKCSDDYAARGVPLVALVDTNGKVAFIDNPMYADLEKSIESLLSGGDVIKRVNIGASTEAGDPANIKEEMLKFSTEVGEKIKTNEVLKNCELDAGFMDAVSQSTYDIHTNTMTTDYTNINIDLSGPQAEIFAARAEIEKILAEFTFEKQWDMEPMD